jgi:Caspase domain
VKYKPSYDESWALVIGINDYQHTNPLEIARADAESIRDALVRDFKFPKKNVWTLLDKQATRAQIMEKFLSCEALAPDDRLIVFFAGHGATVQSSRGPIGYLVPVDGKLSDKSSLIRWDDLTRNADIIPAKHILFIMDACYSGLAIQRTSSTGERRFVSDMLQRPSRQVITAGKADEVVSDGGGPTGNNSIFTGYLLEDLRGAAADKEGVITASNLMNFAYRKVATDSRSKQTPHFGHLDGDGDFILWQPTNGDGKSATKDFLVSTAADRAEPPIYVDWNLPTAGFAERNNYYDVEKDSFGRNEWSDRLGERRKEKCMRAFGWLSLVVEPVSNEPIVLDIAALTKSLRNQIFGDVERQQTFHFPGEAMTTAKSLILYDPAYASDDSAGDCWERYVRVDRSGAIEYCEFERVARFVSLQEGDTKPYQVFFYVQLIGTIWVFLHAVKEILGSAGYSAGPKYSVNLIGTKDAILADFAHTVGKENKKWAQPFEPGFFGDLNLSKLRCSDANLQLLFRVVLGSLSDSDLTKIICDCADQLGLAFNHQSQPRCFTFGTQDFPWREYRPTGF